SSRSSKSRQIATVQVIRGGQGCSLRQSRRLSTDALRRRSEERRPAVWSRRDDADGCHDERERREVRHDTPYDVPTTAATRAQSAGDESPREVTLARMRLVEIAANQSPFTETRRQLQAPFVPLSQDLD